MSDPLDKLGAGIRAVAPHLSPDAVTAWAAALLAPMRSSGITNVRRMSAFLGQVAQESGGFSVLVENLNYSAPRLCQVWPSCFPTYEDAVPYAYNPAALANKVYAGRMGNGNEDSGDGWRFRGSGLIELTGRGMTARFAASCGKTPEDASAWLLTPAGAAASACWFWTLTDHRPSLNSLADTWSLTAITRAVNGGDAGLSTRISLANAALKVLM